MRQRREVVGDDEAGGDRDHDDSGHRQRKVSLLAEGHQQLHAKLHTREIGKRGLLRVCDRQALEPRVDSRLRAHCAHRQGRSKSRQSDQARHGSVRRNGLS
jgi:hypothetical protein